MTDQEQKTYVFDADEVELRPGQIVVPADWYSGVMTAQSFFELQESGCTQFIGEFKITEGEYAGTSLQDRGLYDTPEAEGTDAYEKHMKGIVYTKQKLKTLALAVNKPKIETWAEWFNIPVAMKVTKKENLYKGEKREQNEIQVFKKLTDNGVSEEADEYWNT